MLHLQIPISYKLKSKRKANGTRCCDRGLLPGRIGGYPCKESGRGKEGWRTSIIKWKSQSEIRKG